MNVADLRPVPPEGEREARRYVDYFVRNGVTKGSILKSVELTYARSNVFFDDTYTYFEKSGTFDIACAKGCAFCCHTMVSVVPPEAFYLANYIRTEFDADASRAMIERIVAHDAENRGKSGAARHIGRIACPMLDPESHLCTVHAGRPLTCRSMHSSDVSACRTGFENRDAYHPTPSHALFFKNTQAYYDAYGTALHDAGLFVEPLELNAALATIFTEKNVFLRWLKGENPFENALADAALTDAPPPA